jgi:hypothetical protein
MSSTSRGPGDGRSPRSGSLAGLAPGRQQRGRPGRPHWPMVYTIGDTLSLISHVHSALGDLLVTGTPSGGGYARTPPWLLLPATSSRSRSNGSASCETPSYTAACIVGTIRWATRERSPLSPAPSCGGTRMQEGTSAFDVPVRAPAAPVLGRPGRLPLSGDARGSPECRTGPLEGLLPGGSAGLGSRWLRGATGPDHLARLDVADDDLARLRRGADSGDPRSSS